ncbi:T9SS type A sorting domain-containing protein [candidate division WOR-3 bacterium]|nr:T9SS type A sorting domain-containing protein [candidate division WOR-3 bacterium]
MPQRGAKGVCDGRRFIYATKGNNTAEFWRYDIVTDSWRQLTSVPGKPYQKLVKDGSDLAWVQWNGADYVYLLKGGKHEFWRYDIAADQWQPLAEAPGKRGWKAGSWLVYDNSGSIYAHKAGYHEFYRYDVATDKWRQGPLRGVPLVGSTGEKKSKAGAAAALYAGNIYALKGGKTGEFWTYQVARDSWQELGGLPLVSSTGKKREVGPGGDIVHLGDGYFFATKGNSTFESWISIRSDPQLGRLPDEERCLCLDSSTGRQRIGREATSSQSSPDTPTTAYVYDISGRCLARTRLAAGTVCRVALPEGVYLVRFAGLDKAATRKTIIWR